MAIVFVAASIVIIFGVRHVYLNYYQPYADVAVAQVDPKLFEPWPQHAEYRELPQEQLEATPKLNQAFGKVNEEFERVVSQCPPSEVVYCDLEANTKVTYDITANELQLLLNSDLNFYETKPHGQWIAFVTHDDCYSEIPFVSPDELATAYGNGNGKCYYTIKLDLIY